MGSPVNLIGSNKNKNYVINGGMRIGQRGDVACANNTFKYGGADRWAVGPFLTTCAGTITKAAFSTGTHFTAQALFVSSSTGAGTIQFFTRLEARNVYRLNGKTVTIQLKCYQNTGAAINLGVQIATPTPGVDNWSGGTTNLTSPTFSIPNAVETQISFTHTFGANDCTNGLEIRPFYSIAGALTSKNFYISDVQMEEGPVATPLETMSWDQELHLCQRYCIVIPPGSGHANGAFTQSTVGTVIIHLPVEMRASPTPTIQNPGSYRLNNATNNYRVSAVAAFGSNQKAVTLLLSVTTAAANGAAISSLDCDNIAGPGLITADAEL